ncbi:TPR_REGION domain-containing protein [Caenorhabditis elegans]|nr:TPR_REGION domain-containing protein [Caenorhabditis elegans]CDK13583.1 TPR_REGION domain-containing protein [Caenorhabditis elegans]|eukprot:NP_001293253.1 Uncharacterized protein CELE_Y34D9A.3 [Caenorhabditis elegans]
MKKTAIGQDEVINRIFTSLLKQILRDETRKKLDPHVVLDFLDAGDKLFLDSETSKKAYAILKLYFLCRNRKSKLECFSCGCVQKYFIELYKDGTRLHEALNCLIKSKLSDSPTIIERLFNAMTVISAIEYFEYYIELLGELQNCSVIDKTDEKPPSRLIQLLGLLCETRLEDIPRACSKLISLLEPVNEKEQKKKFSILETVLKSKLLPRIFDNLMANPLAKLDLNRNSVQKYVEIIVNEKYLYALEASVLFAPLQLLNRIFLEFDAFAKSWPIIKNRLELVTIDAPQASILLIYVLSLIYRNDISEAILLGEFDLYLEKQFPGASVVGKRIIIIFFDIMKLLGAEKPKIHSYFKENRTKTKLLMNSELELAVEYLRDFSDYELNWFLQQRADEDFQFLLETAKNLQAPVNSDGFWRNSLEKFDENSIIFIENQLKIMATRIDRKGLALRIQQISQKMMQKSGKIEEKTAIFIKFPQILLEIADFSILPPNSSNLLFSTLILGFSAFYDGNEAQFNDLFRQFLSKTIPNSTCTSPMEIIEEICEKIRIKSNFRHLPDISFLKPNPDTIITQISEIFDTKIAKNDERIVEICSILLEKLAPQLQAFGDRGKTPFCQIVNIIVDKYVKNSVEPVNFQLFREVCERAVDGFAMMTEQWNFLFLSAKILTILNLTRREAGLFAVLMRKINKNEILLTKLRGKKEFVQLEGSLEL